MCCCSLLVRILPYSAPRALHCDLISVFLFSPITPQSNYCILSLPRSLPLSVCLSLPVPAHGIISVLPPTNTKVTTVHHLSLATLPSQNSLVRPVYVNERRRHSSRVCVHPSGVCMLAVASRRWQRLACSVPAIHARSPRP